MLDLYARNLAVGMANNEHALASGVYIVHGDVCAGGETFMTRLRAWMERFSPRRREVPILLTGGETDEMALLGGGGLVLSTVFGAGI
jgi:hypothetical protein